ncbi:MULTISPECIES: hypothetical protein [Corynebacterium]|nr:hypothetical protein [Corynebacterium kefirresidentii]MCG7240835.1 hypothetical protein [Corynebacterium kefirresidentii]MCG7283375.1 hypothetical protein [Corynebacterium kefirresidentii]
MIGIDHGAHIFRREARTAGYYFIYCLEVQKSFRFIDSPTLPGLYF